MQSITSENLIREWERTHKKDYKNIVRDHRNAHNALYHYNALTTTTTNDDIENTITDRINKVNFILRQSIIAPHDDSLAIEAGNRAIFKQAPCHTKDSYLDALNILTIIKHLKNNPVEPVYFTTINYTDFAISEVKKHELHTDLAVDFSNVKLVYEYFQERDHAGRLMNVVLRNKLPSYSDYLVTQQRAKDQLSVTVSTDTSNSPLGIDENEFIQHLRYIDMITSGDTPTSLELKMLDMITESHPSYKQYFLRKLSA